MNFTAPLIEARLIKRYKRFLADAELADGTIITAHCPNPGSMMGLTAPGSQIWLSQSDNPKRKLRFTFEMIKLPGKSGSLVGINTNLPNRISEELILSRRFAEFGDFSKLRREVKYGKNSRIDILLSSDHGVDTYVEVKSVTLQRQPGLHEFPDGVTERGRKHLGELADVVASGKRAIMLYLIQREDGDRFKLARDIDPLYADSFDAAIAGGVEAFAIRCKIDTNEICADKMITIDEPALG